MLIVFALRKSAVLGGTQRCVPEGRDRHGVPPLSSVQLVGRAAQFFDVMCAWWWCKSHNLPGQPLLWSPVWECSISVIGKAGIEPLSVCG